MQREIALILVNKLVGLPFVEVLAGLVQTVTKSDPTDEAGTMVTKRFPVATDTNLPATCNVTNERALIPNSSKGSIIYFEDLGTNAGPNRGRFSSYNSNLRLVCWMNKNKLFENANVNATSSIIAGIINRLETRNPENNGMFVRMKVRANRIPIFDANIFSKYTYKEEDRQYLRPPFDFFAIDFTINYEISPACLV